MSVVVIPHILKVSWDSKIMMPVYCLYHRPLSRFQYGGLHTVRVGEHLHLAILIYKILDIIANTYNSVITSHTVGGILRALKYAMACRSAHNRRCLTVAPSTWRRVARRWAKGGRWCWGTGRQESSTTTSRPRTEVTTRSAEKGHSTGSLSSAVDLNEITHKILLFHMGHRLEYILIFECWRLYILVSSKAILTCVPTLMATLTCCPTSR